MLNRFASNPFEPSDEHVSPKDSWPPSATGDSEPPLRGLIQASDLSVVFQPIVRVATGEVYAYEALVRCSVPAYKNPLDLFARAVTERCVGRLGRTIRAVAVPLCPGVPVFFNIHPVELADQWLVRPDDPIYTHDEPVFLEITESVPLEHFALCRSALREICERAEARLVVDDLGAGYSNLKYIADLDPSVVKLDRNLIMDIHRQPRVQRLVYWLVRLCRDLGAEVVAEGVETAEEFACVRDQGVQLVQGYYFARPGFPLPLADQVRRDARGRTRTSATWAAVRKL